MRKLAALMLLLIARTCGSAYCCRRATRDRCGKADAPDDPRNASHRASQRAARENAHILVVVVVESGGGSLQEGQGRQVPQVGPWGQSLVKQAGLGDSAFAT